MSHLSLDLEAVHRSLHEKSAAEVIDWAAATFGGGLVVSTSFGIHSAVILHLVTRRLPDVPVIWVDTGYLPEETYQFAETLTRQLKLNLRVYQSRLSPARMEALYGRLWDSEAVEDLNRYDHIRKVEPMQRALEELGAKAWVAGLRQHQTDFRQQLRRVERQNEQLKIHPLLYWSARDLYHYLREHDLPQHPYFERGYVTVGDWHSSRPLLADDTSERNTRFKGLKQECGIHLSSSTSTQVY